MSFLNRFADWVAQKQFQRNEALFRRLYDDPRSNMRATVREAGWRIAMRTLDDLRIRHCFFCPSVAPLVAYRSTMVCQGHLEFARKHDKYLTQKQEEENKHAKARGN